MRTADACAALTAAVLLVRAPGSHALDPARPPEEYITRTWGVGEGLPQNSVTAAVQTRDGYVWLGTYSGLVRFDGVSFRILNRWNTPELKNDRITRLYEDPEGALWIGTYGGGVFRLHGGAWQNYSSLEGLSNDFVTSIVQDRGGATWVGTEGAGLARVQPGGRISTLTAADGLSSDDITALVEDGSGTLWIGTARGLNRLKDGRFRAYDRTTDLGSAPLRTLFRNAAGVLHVGTREGLIKFYDHSPLPLYLNEEGIEPDVLCIHEDAAGVLWIGTAGNGLIRYKDTEVTTYTTSEGLPDNHVFGIVEDGRGDFYMSSYVGVFRIPGAQMEAVRTGTERRFMPALYDDAEGFRNRQCTFDGEPSACEGEGGCLCFTTIEGVAVLYPEDLDREGEPPRAIIEDMTADNLPVAGEGADLSRSPHVLQFRFTALDFQAPEKVRFEYRLRGYEDNWNSLSFGNPRTAYYFNLKPGDYAFMVRAAGNEGVWAEEPASFEFRILRPLYRRPEFYALLVALLGAGAAGLAVRRRRKPAAPEKYSTSALADEKVDEVLPKLRRLMDEEKVYLDADLNLQELARKTGIHYNYLSRIINEKFGLSYNDYVNGYRIEEAKRMLGDPENDGRTILDIAYDTGFYSKSVFNTAFKKITGMTPSQYRKARKKGDS